MNDEGRVRVLVAEDFPDLASLYRQIVSMQSDMELVEVVSSGARLMQRAQEGAADVIVLDLHLSGELTTDLVPRLSQHSKVVVVSGRSEPELVQSLLAAGAVGYVPKTLTLADDLLAAIRAAASGRTYIHKTAPSSVGY